MATLQTTSVPQGDTTGWDVEIKADLAAINSDAANALAIANAALTASNSATNTVPVKTVVTTTYTLVLADQGQAVEFTNAAGCTVTIPPNVFPTGAALELRQVGVGAVTVAPGSGVTLNQMGTRVSGGQWAILGLVNRGTNLWLLSGDTTA